MDYAAFINTGLQPGAMDENSEKSFQRFSLPRGKPFKRLALRSGGHTRLKPGVNEIRERCSIRRLSLGISLVSKVADAGEDHRHVALVSGRDHFFVTN